MFRPISNMPISRRLLIAFALTAAIPGIVIVLLGTYYINSLTIRGQAVKTSFDAQNTAFEQQINLNEMSDNLSTRFTAVFASMSENVHDPALSNIGDMTQLLIDSRKSLFDEGLITYQRDFNLAASDNMRNIHDIILSDDPNSTIIQQQKDALKVVLVQWPAYRTQQTAVTDLLTRDLASYRAGHNTPADVQAYYTQVYGQYFQAKQMFLNLKIAWGRVVTVSQDMGRIVTNVGPSQTNPIIITTIIAFLSTILVIVTTGFIINITITRPLRQLANLTKRIAKGETSARALIPGRDEIYMVANSMNNMLDNIVRLIQETQGQRDQLQAQVEKLVSEVSGVGEGDLSLQAEVTADALGVLADSFNYMVEELSSLVVRVKMVASEVGNSTSNILDRMTQLVEIGDNEIHQIAEAAIEIERMAGASRLVADRSVRLTEVARDAREDARNGRQTLAQAVMGMGRINDNVQSTATKVQTLGERSREIDEIVNAISSIAHQTNRLALDAAIQAAMAGENGKGFGAVAADIRRLAERAKEQTTNITRIVRNVREEIGAAAVAMQDTERETAAGLRLTQETGTSLDAIFAAVEYQAKEIEDINGVALQQLQSSSAVVQIMHIVSESTQQNNLSTREASQNMERLARLVEQLRSSVEAFKLREDQSVFPGNNVNVSMEDQDNNMTMSGLFRTVSATAQPAQLSSVGAANALPSPRSNDPFAFYAAQANGNGNGSGWNTPQPQQNQNGNGWGTPQPAQNQNGNGWNVPQQGQHPSGNGWNVPQQGQNQNGNGWNIPQQNQNGNAWGMPQNGNGSWNTPPVQPTPNGNGPWNAPQDQPTAGNNGMRGLRPQPQNNGNGNAPRREPLTPEQQWYEEQQRNNGRNR